MKLYTLPSCPKCRILKEVFNRKGIQYETVCDIEIMHSKGILSVPMVELEDGTLLQFDKALKLE